MQYFLILLMSLVGLCSPSFALDKLQGLVTIATTLPSGNVLQYQFGSTGLERLSFIQVNYENAAIETLWTIDQTKIWGVTLVENSTPVPTDPKVEDPTDFKKEVNGHEVRFVRRPIIEGWIPIGLDTGTLLLVGVDGAVIPIGGYTQDGDFLQSDWVIKKHILGDRELYLIGQVNRRKNTDIKKFVIFDAKTGNYTEPEMKNLTLKQITGAQLFFDVQPGPYQNVFIKDQMTQKNLNDVPFSLVNLSHKQNHLPGKVQELYKEAVTKNQFKASVEPPLTPRQAEKLIDRLNSILKALSSPNYDSIDLEALIGSINLSARRLPQSLKIPTLNKLYSSIKASQDAKTRLYLYETLALVDGGDNIDQTHRDVLALKFVRDLFLDTSFADDDAREISNHLGAPFIRSVLNELLKAARSRSPLTSFSELPSRAQQTSGDRLKTKLPDNMATILHVELDLLKERNQLRPKEFNPLDFALAERLVEFAQDLKPGTEMSDLVFSQLELFKHPWEGMDYQHWQQEARSLQINASIASALYRSDASAAREVFKLPTLKPEQAKKLVFAFPGDMALMRLATEYAFDRLKSNDSQSEKVGWSQVVAEVRYILPRDAAPNLEKEIDSRFKSLPPSAPPIPFLGNVCVDILNDLNEEAQRAIQLQQQAGQPAFVERLHNPRTGAHK